MSLTSPLGLMRHLRKPGLRMEVIPWLNVMLLGLMMYLLGSSYIWAPGLVVTNNTSTLLAQKMHLPTLNVKPGAPEFVGRPDAVLYIMKSPPLPQQLTLDGDLVTLDALPKKLEEFGKTFPGKTPELKMRESSAQTPQFILNSGSYSAEELPLALKKLRQSLPEKNPMLLVKGDNDVLHGTVLRVCAMAQEAGFAAEEWAFLPTGNAAGAPEAGSANAASTNRTP